MKWKRIFYNIIHWLLETVLFALFPLILFYFFYWAFQLNINPIRQCISEVCSCTLAIIVADFTELAKDKYRLKGMRGFLMPIHVLLSLLFALLYGAVYFCMVTEYSLQLQVIQNIFAMMKLICLFHFCFSFLLQIIGGLLQ